MFTLSLLLFILPLQAISDTDLETPQDDLVIMVQETKKDKMKKVAGKMRKTGEWITACSGGLCMICGLYSCACVLAVGIVMWFYNEKESIAESETLWNQ